MSGRDVSDGQRILNLLAERGPMQNYAIVAAMCEHMSFRRVDAVLRRLKRDRKIDLLPRQAGVRPFALWTSHPARLTPENDPPNE